MRTAWARGILVGTASEDSIGVASLRTIVSESFQSQLVRVRGLVQGVGYRWSCVRLAHDCGVSGWVRNRTDGTVEALLQGTPGQLARMRERMQHGVPLARVDGMEVMQPDPPPPLLEGFEQRPTA